MIVLLCVDTSSIIVYSQINAYAFQFFFYVKNNVSLKFLYNFFVDKCKHVPLFTSLRVGLHTLPDLFSWHLMAKMCPRNVCTIGGHLPPHALSPSLSEPLLFGKKPSTSPQGAQWQVWRHPQRKSELEDSREGWGGPCWWTHEPRLPTWSLWPQSWYLDPHLTRPFNFDI